MTVTSSTTQLRTNCGFTTLGKIITATWQFHMCCETSRRTAYFGVTHKTCYKFLALRFFHRRSKKLEAAITCGASMAAMGAAIPQARPRNTEFHPTVYIGP